MNLPCRGRLDQEVVFLSEEWPKAVVVKKQIRLVVEAHALLFRDAEHFADNVERTLKTKTAFVDVKQ